MQIELSEQGVTLSYWLMIGNATTIGLCVCVALLIVTNLCYLACIASFFKCAKPANAQTPTTFSCQGSASLQSILHYKVYERIRCSAYTAFLNSNNLLLLEENLMYFCWFLVILMCQGLSTQDLRSFGFYCTLCNSRRSRHLWHQLDLWRGASVLGKGKDLRVQNDEILIFWCAYLYVNIVAVLVVVTWYFVVFLIVC